MVNRGIEDPRRVGVGEHPRVQAWGPVEEPRSRDHAHRLVCGARRGAMLAETLVALAVFAIGILAALRVEASALRLMAVTQQRQAMVYRAEALLDSLSMAGLDAGASGVHRADGIEAAWQVVERSGASVLELSIGSLGSGDGDRTGYAVTMPHRDGSG